MAYQIRFSSEALADLKRLPKRYSAAISDHEPDRARAKRQIRERMARGDYLTHEEVRRSLGLDSHEEEPQG